MAEEDGFFLLETMAAGLALLALSSCFFIFARSMELQAADGCRVRAAFLARTQFAAAQADANGRGLTTGSYPWQGLPEDLQDGSASYLVETRVESMAGEGETGNYRVTVQVKWQGRPADGELELEREVVRHGHDEGKE